MHNNPCTLTKLISEFIFLWFNGPNVNDSHTAEISLNLLGYYYYMRPAGSGFSQKDRFETMFVIVSRSTEGQAYVMHAVL